MFWYGDGMSGWGIALMTVSMVLFWGLVIVGIVALVRYASRPLQQTGIPQADRRAPDQVLADPFACGEIDEQDYQRRSDVLLEHAPGQGH